MQKHFQHVAAMGVIGLFLVITGDGQVYYKEIGKDGKNWTGRHNGKAAKIVSGPHYGKDWESATKVAKLHWEEAKTQAEQWAVEIASNHEPEPMDMRKAIWVGREKRKESLDAIEQETKEKYAGINLLDMEI